MNSIEAPKPYQIRFPQREEVRAQDEEWCEIKLDGQWQKIRFHDYDCIYQSGSDKSDFSGLIPVCW